MFHETPHVQRNDEVRKSKIPKNRGRLINGNPPGDYLSARRCGVLARKKTPCEQPRMRGKRRCRLHGGKWCVSTGQALFVELVAAFNVQDDPRIVV
jgi:hypothetical protein